MFLFSPCSFNFLAIFIKRDFFPLPTWGQYRNKLALLVSSMKILERDDDYF